MCFAHQKVPFTIHIHSLITFELLLIIKSKVTTNAKNIAHPNQYTYGMSEHVVSRSFKGPGAAANNLTDTKYELVKCQIMFNWICMHYGGLRVPIDKNLKK